MCLQCDKHFCNNLSECMHVCVCMCVCVGFVMCPHCAPVHLHVWTPFPQCSRVKYKGEIWHFQGSLLQAAALDLFPRTALFWKNHCIVIFYYSCDPLEVPQLPFLWHFASSAFPPLPPSSAELGHTRSPPLLPQSGAFLLTSLCPLSLLTLNTNRWPTAPAAPPPPPSTPSMIHLLPAVFHAEEDSCLNVYVKSYFLFL